jgi:4-amino-4-deoxy-L-arabinose transferase-like glycosyltransferase
MAAGTKFSILRSPVSMVLVGFAVRVLYIVIAHSYRMNHEAWFSSEMAGLGYSLATGRGFGSPFGGETGPSAWTAPIYPWITSLAFRIFGPLSYASAFAMLTFNSIFCALTSWTIYRIASRVFDETVAVWSGWVWALFPTVMFWSVIWIWETSLSAFLLSLLFLVTLEMEGDDRLSSWLGYGLLWGILALTNTSGLAWLPFAGCWLAYQLHHRRKRYLFPVVASAVIFWASLMPWLVRDYKVFGKPIFIRGDLGVELRSGNNEQADGGYIASYNPDNKGAMYWQYKRMGEAAFVEEQGDIAKEWIAANPQRFAELTVLRVIYFWAGLPRTGFGQEARNLLLALSSLLAIGGLLLALKRRVHGAFLFATLIVFYPLIYYITFPSARYRHAIEPELIVLAVYLIVAVCAGVRSRRQPARAETIDA